MGGYLAQGRGKSERARLAEEDGLYPATRAAQELRQAEPRLRGLTGKILAATTAASEWHHTGKFFNRTNYYCAESILDDAESVERLAEAVAEAKATAAKPNDGWVKIHGRCYVDWPEWFQRRIVGRGGCAVQKVMEKDGWLRLYETGQPGRPRRKKVNHDIHFSCCPDTPRGRKHKECKAQRDIRATFWAEQRALEETQEQERRASPAD